MEVRVKENVKKELVSSLTWAGHAERMGNETLAKRADAQKMEGERGRWGIAEKIRRKRRRRMEKVQQTEGVVDC